MISKDVKILGFPLCLSYKHNFLGSKIYQTRLIALANLLTPKRHNSGLTLKAITIL